jgi:hypothetical protein
MKSIKKQEGYLGIGNRRVLGIPKPSGDPTPAGPASALLLENGDGFLLEDGSFLLLENN